MQQLDDVVVTHLVADARCSTHGMAPVTPKTSRRWRIARSR
jgi:hypothetical protein